MSPAASASPPRAPLVLRLKKKAGGEPVVTFVRRDGTVTTGRLGPGDFGAVHDLTHYVVESSLHLRLGFLGLVADGRDVADFAIRHANRDWPDEAFVAECLVGQLGNAIFQARRPAPEEFNWLVASALAAVRPGARAPVLSGAALDLIHERLTGLLRRWRALPPGETLELPFSFD